MIEAKDVLTLALIAKIKPVTEVVEDNFEDLYEYYVRTNQIPYEDAKDDPYTWIQVQLTKEV